MHAYRQNLEGGLLDYACKQYSSHRRIPVEKLEELTAAYAAKNSIT